MKLKSFFLSTRVDQNNMYRFIVGMCFKNASFKNKENIELKQIRLIKKPSVKFLLFVFFCSLKGNFFKKEKISKIKYKNIRIGKYIISTTFKDHLSYLSKFTFALNVIKNTLKSSFYINTAEYYCKNLDFKNVYLDHVYYLNGIYFDYFACRKKIIYTNDYPGSISKIDFQSLKNRKILYYENFLRIKFLLNNFSEKEKEKILNIRNNILGNKNHFRWIKNVKTTNIKKNTNLKKYDYIIYTHSFTDAQHIFGHSAFVNTLDWLIFTIKKLLKNNKKIIIKCHPSFKDKFEVNINDQIIFTKYLKKYINDPNIFIMDEPYLNKSLIAHLNSKCIAITHHGTVSLEMMQNNFKVISSNCGIWDKKYKLTNCWSTKHQYLKLLNSNWDDLKFHNNRHFQNILFNLFCGKKTHFSQNEHVKIVLKYLKKNISSEQGNNFDLTKRVNKKTFIKIISHHKLAIDYK